MEYMYTVALNIHHRRHTARVNEYRPLFFDNCFPDLFKWPTEDDSEAFERHWRGRRSPVTALSYYFCGGVCSPMWTDHFLTVGLPAETNLTDLSPVR